MKAIADTGFLVAFGNRRDKHHKRALEIAARSDTTDLPGMINAPELDPRYSLSIDIHKYVDVFTRILRAPLDRTG